MFQRKTLLASGVLTLAASATVFATKVATGPVADAFDELTMTLEVNTTDEDIAVRIAMEIAEEFLGIEGFAVRDPFGNEVLLFEAPGSAGMALTEFIAEAGRDDVQSGLAEFPPGDYLVEALTIDGQLLAGVAHLSHDLPIRPRILQPAAQAIVGPGDLQVVWGSSGDVDHYILEIESEELDLNLEVSADITSFRVPANILQPNTTYQLGITAINAAGNSVVHEIQVSTGQEPRAAR